MDLNQLAGENENKIVVIGRSRHIGRKRYCMGSIPIPPKAARGHSAFGA